MGKDCPARERQESCGDGARRRNLAEQRSRSRAVLPAGDQPVSRGYGDGDEEREQAKEYSQ